MTYKKINFMVQLIIHDWWIRGSESSLIPKGALAKV